MTSPPRPRAARLVPWIAAAGAACATALAMRPSIDAWVLWNDAVEHLAIGHVWASGRGFVDPVQYLTFYETSAVLPGFVVRAPVVPALLGLLFAAGSTARTAIQVHAIWSCLVVGLLVLAARRMMRWPAAAAAGLWIGWMPAWLHLSRMPMTEVTAVATFAAVLSTVSWACRSGWGALVCGCLTVLAAATRPNFAILGAAVFVASALHQRPHGFRSPLPWIHLGTVGGGLLLLGALAFAATGWEPYGGYGGLVSQIVERNTSEGIVEMVLRNSRNLVDALAERRFGAVLWLAVPGFFWCLRGGVASSPERRFSALALLGLVLVAIATLGRWDSSRYPLPVAIPGVFCAAALVDDLSALAVRRGGPRLRCAGAIAPALLLAWMALGARDPARFLSLDPWFLRDLQSRPVVASERERALVRLCRLIPADELVIAQDPWSVYSWCGNAAVLLQKGLGKQSERERFFGGRGARWVVMKGFAPREWETGAVRVVPIAGAKPYVLYTVVGASAEPLRWSSPGPLVCASFRRGCISSAAPRDPAIRKERSGSPAKRSRGEARAERS